MNKEKTADDEFARQIEDINNKLGSLREKISNLRKQGKNPFYADLLFRQASAKVHYAEVTRKKEDRDKILELISEAEEELRHEEQREEKTLMDEINHMVELDRMMQGTTSSLKADTSEKDIKKPSV